LAVIVVGVRGETNVNIGDNRTEVEKQLMIADGPHFHDQDVISIGAHFKEEYDQLVENFYDGKCAMVLIKNVVATSYGDRHLRAQAYTIFTQIVEEDVRARLLDLHNTITGNQPPRREVCLIAFFLN
jgi:hypothetical protein